MPRIRRAITCALLASTSFAVPTVSAIAQQATAENNLGAATGLEQIVVTGRKRAENLQNIPVAETVVSGEQIAKYQVNSIEKLNSLAPSLVIGRSGSGTGASIGLRGISVPTTSISLEQSVATIIDGVYYQGGRALNEGLFDLAQVEVLKGPQALFYGKNTTAGAISLTTANPTRSFEAMARASYEFNAKQPQIEGYVSGPISDTLQYRVAARISKQFGALFKNVTSPVTELRRDVATGALTSRLNPAVSSDLPGENQQLVRATLRYEPASQFTATIKGSFNNYHSRGAQSNQVISACAGGSVQSDPSAPCGHIFVLSQQGNPAEEAASNPLIGKHGGKPYNDYRSYSATADLRYEGEKFTLSVLPAYSWWRNEYLIDSDDTNNAPVTPGANGGKTTNSVAERATTSAFSVESRLQTRLGGAVNFMAGGYYQNTKLRFLQDLSGLGCYCENSAVTDPSLHFLALRKVSHTYGETFAGFGQVLVDVTSTLNVNGGVRYTHETKDSVFAQPYVNSTIGGTYVSRSIGADQTFRNWSPEATVSWKPRSNLTVYGSYRTGYKSGGYSISGLITVATKVDNPRFNPEKVAGFEGGIKSTLFDNQLRLNLDLYSYKYKDLQVDYFDSSTREYFTLNAASARTKGGELQLEFAPRAAPGLRMSGSIAYNRARYLSFPFAPCIAGQSIAQGCTFGVTPNGTRTNQDLTGKALQQAPQWTGSTQVEYRFALAGERKLLLSANGRYSSSYATNPFVTSQLKDYIQSPFATLDATITFQGKGDRWEVGVIGRNLTNHFIVTTSNNLSGTGSGTGAAIARLAAVRAGVADPRTVMVQGTVRF